MVVLRVVLNKGNGRDVMVTRLLACGPRNHSTFLLLPFGAGFILGVYVTVRVTTSRMCFTLVLEGFLASFNLLALRAASQSNTEWTDLALKGERTVLALMGESR